MIPDKYFPWISPAARYGRGLKFDVVYSTGLFDYLQQSTAQRLTWVMFQMLRPGGRLLIVDVRGTRQHQAQLAKLGMHGVGRTGLGWWSWPARLVTATKPQPGN